MSRERRYFMDYNEQQEIRKFEKAESHVKSWLEDNPETRGTAVGCLIQVATIMGVSNNVAIKQLEIEELEKLEKKVGNK